MEFVKHLLRGTRLHRLILARREVADARVLHAEDCARREFYAQFVRPGDLCFDIGANVGTRTKALLQLDARVVAVEPNAACTRILRAGYGENPRLTIVEQAVGAAPGVAELLMTDEAHTLSSLSAGWITAVRTSGRFDQYAWTRHKTVQLMTLDQLIDAHGVPTFIKIDVEGYEAEVLRGLSHPVRTIAFEFTPEWIDSSVECIRTLSALAPVRLNLSLGETLRFALPHSVGPAEMVEHLRAYTTDTAAFGDIYAISGV